MSEELDEFFNAAQHKGTSTMSLEKAIEANTAALLVLAAAYSGNKTAPAAKPAAEQPAAANAALDYEKDVKPLALRVAKEKGRDALVAILTEYKVAQANLLKPEQWGEFIKKCNASLTEKALA